ncbi:MAG: calcium/sodium antiporter [Clostridia bacterium]|nr:calcium/sodium antiporter [Clostridia bacterium]
MILEVVWIILGFILLIKGADFLVDGSSKVAKKFHIPEIIIGLTIVSIGTSMPELFVSITSAIDGYPDMAVGNVIGSNLCNLLLILGLSAVIMPIEFKKETRFIEIPITLAVTLVLFVLCNIGANITRIEGMILVVLFILFIGYTIFMAKRGEQFEKKDTLVEVQADVQKISIVKSILWILLGVIGLKIGGDLVVNHSVIVAKAFNISEKVISLTIIAIGTSLPELVTSVTAAIKGDSDIAIGNILGSNIFNILLILGVSAIITPITYSVSYNNQILVLIIATVLLALFPFIGAKNKMTRSNGIAYLIIYAIYMAGLFIA